MEKLLIIAAIIVAVLLLSGSIVPPRRPNFLISDRTSKYGLSYRISVLGGRSGAVERGNGISTGAVCRALRRSIKTVYKKLDAGVKLEYWERVFLDNAEAILSAIEKSSRGLRFGYKLGHVNGVPRIYSFCDELVRSTGGQIDSDLLFRSLKTFSSGFELGYNELKILNECVIFCLCGYISAWINIAEKRQRSFDKGVSDGRSGRFDLDSVKRNDYVCGLFYGSTANDYAAFERIAEINGTDRADAERARRLFFARVCAAVEQSSFSIKKISENGFPFEFSKPHAVLMSDIVYLESSDEKRLKYLAYVWSYARSHACSEEFAADELIKSNQSQELCNKVYKKNRALFAFVFVNVFPVVLVGLTIWLLIAANAPFLPIFCVSSLFTVYSGGYKLLSCVFGDWLQPLELVFVKPINKRLLSVYNSAQYVIVLLTPLSELISVLFCACAFSPSALFVATAVFISDVLSCIFIAASELSIKRLYGIVKALERFITEPPIALLSAFCSVCDRLNVGKFISEKQYNIIAFELRFILGVAVICFAAILAHSAVMIAIGALILSGTVMDQAKYATRSVKKRILSIVRKRKTDGKSVAVLGSIIPSERFFGGETEYKSSVIKSESVNVFSDNRGEIYAEFRSAETLECDLNIGISLTDEKSIITTESCHGAFEKYRTVYKHVNNELEISIELLAPIDLRSCLCKIIVCNRTAIKRSVELCVRCSRRNSNEFDGEKESIDKSGIIVSGKNALGVFVVGQPVDVCATDSLLQVKNIINLDGMKKGIRLVPIIVDKDARAVVHSLSQVDADFYDYEYSGTKAYASAQDDGVRNFGVDSRINVYSRLSAPSLNFEAGADAMIDSEDRNDEVALFGRNAQSVASLHCNINTELPEVDFDERLPVGGFLQNGSLCIIGRDSFVGALSDNILCDGQSCVNIADNGAVSFDSQCFGENVGIKNIFMLIGEGGAIWSPTQYPIGVGEYITTHERGCSRFICAYNGCLSTLVCFHASDKRAVVFDLQIENNADDDRIFDIMCAFTPTQNMLPVKVVKRGFNINVLKSNGMGLTVMSSIPFTDYTTYREGYRRYGTYDRASGFRTGGSSVAPAASVRIKIVGGGKERVVFCVAAKTDGPMLDSIDENSAAALLHSEIDKYNKISNVLLTSSDKAFNHIFAFAAARSYALGRRDEFLHGIDTHGLKLDKLLALFKISDRNKISFGADILLCAAARYKMGDYSAAYKSLSMFVKKVAIGEVYPDAMTFSLFRALVCERLLGLSELDDKVRIRPATCDSTPHIEFDLLSDSGSSHIVLCDGEGDGSWFMKIGRITYLSDTIKIGEQDMPIIMGRLDENGITNA